MNQGWDVFSQFLFLCLMLGVATVIKLNVKFLQRHLIPTAMIAGFIGLIVGPEIAGWVPFNSDILGKLVYHLMGVGFIALALKDRKSKRNRNIMNTGFLIVNTYIWQAIIGFGVALILINTFFPDLFPGFGLLLPLSFAQGPGQAYGIGNSWEVIDGISAFPDGGNIGLSLATIGFLWAFIGGIPLMNILVRRYRKKKKDNALNNPTDSVEVENLSEHTVSVPRSIYVDDFTLQIILIGAIYAATYGLLTLFQAILPPLGTLGVTLANLFWGFNFLLGTLLALLAKKILNGLKKKGILKVNFADNYLLQRVSATSFDLMITAAIAAISMTALRNYLWPVLIITTIGGAFTLFYVVFLTKRIYKTDIIEHIVTFYGTWTGTITTGVALLREVDPHNKTDVAEEYVLGSGVAAGFAFPLMMLLALPITGYLNKQPWLYVLTFILFFVYSAVMFGCIWLNNKRYDSLEKRDK